MRQSPPIKVAIILFFISIRLASCDSLPLMGREKLHIFRAPFSINDSEQKLSQWLFARILQGSLT